MPISPLRRRGSGGQKPSGFTLVEVLVALAMTGMLVSLLMSSLYYGTRVQASLADELQLREGSLRRIDWFARSLQGCMPQATLTGARFVATEIEIRCTSVAPLQARALPSPQRIRWALRKSAADARVVELTYKDLDDAQASELVVQRFDFAEARFVYVGVDGQQVAAWPNSPDAAETLPRLVYVAFREGNSVQTAWATSLLADPWLEQELKNPFGMELPR